MSDSGVSSLLPLPMNWGDNALAAPTTPEHRLPVIDRAKVDPELLKGAQGMESMFINYMMKEMRKTVPKNDMDLESPATEIYRDMQDTETAERAANAGGIGLADQIIAYMESRRYNLPQGDETPRVKAAQGSAQAQGPSADPVSVARLTTGGTHEGQPVSK